MQIGLARSKEIYDRLSIPFAVNPLVQLWRLRYRTIYLFSMAGLWLNKHPDEMNPIASWVQSQSALLIRLYPNLVVASVSVWAVPN
jgi:hypothetical protein